MKKYQKAVSSEAAFGVYGVKLCSARLYFRTAKIKGEELFVMELYLFLALLLIYILTAFMVKKVILHKIWTLAFILAFVVTAVSIAFIRVSGQDVMMSANELNWYYLLYLFGSLSVVLGIINVWMYRRSIWKIMSASDSDDDDEDTDK